MSKTNQKPVHFNGWVKLKRGDLTNSLIRNPNAFLLLTQIALRARRTDICYEKTLKRGQAFLGDHQNIGLTRCQYRTALTFLKKNGFVKVEKTSAMGTVVRLISRDIFDINESATATSVATSSPVNSQQVATNKKTNNEKKERSPTQAEKSISNQSLIPKIYRHGDTSARSAEQIVDGIDFKKLKEQLKNS